MDTVLLFYIAVILTVGVLFMDRAITAFEQIARSLETLAEK